MRATLAPGCSSRRFWRSLLLLVVVSTLGACGGGGGGDTSSSGDSATLAWDASLSPDVVGYRVYYGIAPGEYFQPFGQGVDVGNATTHTVMALAGATTYYFSATAYDSFGQESAYSNEVSKTIP